MVRRRLGVLLGILVIVGVAGVVDLAASGAAAGASGPAICFPATRATAVTPLRGYPAAAMKRRLLPGQLPVSLRVTPLPAVLYARASGSAVIDQQTAERVLAAMWSSRERANAQDDGPMLSRLETGAARAWDVAEADENLDAGTRSLHVVRPMLAAQVEVPYQRTYPACFLAIVGSTSFPDNGDSPGTPVIDVLVFSRTNAATPWRVAIHTDIGGVLFENETILREEVPDPVHDGFVARAAPSGWLPARSVYPALAAYWQHWKDDGSPPPGAPFLPGTYSSGAGQYFATTLQDRVNPTTGARLRETFEAEPSADGRFEFAVRNGWTVTCSAVRGHALITPGSPGATLRQTNQYAWGFALPIGNYVAIKDTTLRQSCVAVEPTRSGGAIVLGIEGDHISQIGITASALNTSSTRTRVKRRA